MKSFKSFIFSCLILAANTNTTFSQNVSDSTKVITVKVKGINCQMDVKTISDNISKVKGVNSCETSKPGATTTFNVVYNPNKVSEKEIHLAVENTPGCEDPEEKPYKVKK